MNLDKALNIFVAEAGELLADMETALLQLETDPGNMELIHSMFRAAHTIKGSAGIFKLDAIVAITHVMESVMDKVRDGEIAVTPQLIAVLLPCRDYIEKLVGFIPGMELDNATVADGHALREQLNAFLGKPAAEIRPGLENPPPAVQEAQVESSGGGPVETDNWHLSLRFGQDVLRNGMDPLSFIRYLGTLGKIISITTLTDALPPAAKMNPESCYLGFEIDFNSEASKETIENVFEFVREDSSIHILPPHSMIDKYIELIRNLPEDDRKIGEILVESGALTRNELDACLAYQASQSRQVPVKPLGEILIEKHAVQEEVVESALEKQKQNKDGKGGENRLVRVQADKLDSLINLVGELVIAGAGANLLAQKQNNSALLEATALMTRLVEEIRDSALRLRMVQIGETFSRFQRVVRDVSKELGKEIDLLVTGAETELDKSVVEKIGDPLMHLVRNAMDHGIEPTEKRLAAGKPAKGTLHLNAYHDSGSIVIEISDDGGGLNRDRILQKARERGLVAEGATPGDQEIYNLIFEAGFSTAEAVTNLSGRGVGMDVVRRNINALRGSVNLDSKAGMGTTVSIRLPLTLAIIDGFLVEVGKSSYVVPLDVVQECIELNDEDRSGVRERGFIKLRGEVLPLVLLSDHFEVKSAAQRRENVVVVKYAEKMAGLVVDELKGEFQTVIKPLGKIFSSLRGISGSTILGTGEVALILDVSSLVQQAVARETQQAIR